jgi:tetratricopeptide (TPR) repeat protein
LVRARLAEITNDEGHVKAARADFDRAKQSDENCYLARLNRGRYFLETDGFYGPAEEELLAAMRLNPGGEGRGEPFYLMAKLYDDSRNPGRNAVKAAENYKKYLEREPDGRHAAEVRERLKTIAAEFPTP